MEAAGFSETSVNFSRSKWQYCREDGNFLSLCYENLRCRMATDLMTKNIWRLFPTFLTVMRKN